MRGLTCELCGVDLVQPLIGRPRKFCSGLECLRARARARPRDPKIDRIKYVDRIERACVKRLSSRARVFEARLLPACRRFLDAGSTPDCFDELQATVRAAIVELDALVDP